MVRRLRLWGPRASAALVLPLLFVVAVGCGSGSSDTTTDAAAPRPAAGDDAAHAATPQPVATPERKRQQSKTGASPQVAQGGDRGGAERASSGRGGSASPSHPKAGKQKVSKACPSGISRSECETLVTGYQQTKDKPSHPVQEPEDCLKAMSRGECERLLEGQQEAAEKEGVSIDVQQCLRNPTPRCEEILRAAFEAQVAAGATGK